MSNVITTHTPLSDEWIACADRLPPDGALVDTTIDDDDGVRNEQPMKRHGRLWFVADGSVYVYYAPTHWRSRHG